MGLCHLELGVWGGRWEQGFLELGCRCALGT